MIEVQETSPAIVEVHDPAPNTVVEVHDTATNIVVEIHSVSAGTVEVHTGSGVTAQPATPFVFVMPAAQTTATVDHHLGHDPISIQVEDEFGTVYTEFSIVYTVPGEQVRLGFDLPIKATIRMM